MKLNTPLSNFEAGRNYQDVQDPAITVKIRLIDFEIQNVDALVWTITPWTLPANLAVCVGSEIDYVVVQDKKDNSYFFISPS